MSTFTRIGDKSKVDRMLVDGDVTDIIDSSNDIPTLIRSLGKPLVDVAALYEMQAQQSIWPFLADVPVSVPDLADVDYHSIKAWSKSMISNMKDSPAHMRYALDHPREPTDAMIIGSATHTMVLENHKFESVYAIKPKFKMNTNIGKAAYQAWLDEDPGRLTKKHLDMEDYQTARGIRESVMAHPYASKLIEVDGLVELSSFWMDRGTGLFCKSRQDKLCVWENELTIIDLKTTTDASPSGFRSQLFNFEYHVQAAYYCEAISEIEKANCTRFIFIAVEKEPPHVCAVYMLEPEALGQGRQTYMKYLKQTKDCAEKDLWPGYSDNLEPITLPPFAFKTEY